MNSDRELLSAFVRFHDERAFAELVARHGVGVRAAAAQVLRDKHLADDAAQIAFAALAQKSASLPDEISISGWLCRTAQLTARDFNKATVRRRHHEHVAAVLRTADGASDSGRQHAQDATAALNTLKPAERAVVELRFFSRLSRTEIAQRLNCPEGTVQTRVNRALQRLRKALSLGGMLTPLTWIQNYGRAKQKWVCAARLLYWWLTAAFGGVSVLCLAAALGAFAKPPVVTVTPGNVKPETLDTNSSVIEVRDTQTASVRTSRTHVAVLCSTQAKPNLATQPLTVARAAKAENPGDDEDVIGLRTASASPPTDESIIGLAPVAKSELPIRARTKVRIEQADVDVAKLLSAGQRYSATGRDSPAERLFRSWLNQQRGN